MIKKRQTAFSAKLAKFDKKYPTKKAVEEAKKSGDYSFLEEGDTLSYGGDINEHNLISSLGEDGVTHYPVLDMDFPVYAVPSRTPGHTHLYIDKEVDHKSYMKLLDALAEAGLIETGYCAAAKKKGQTFLRIDSYKKLIGLVEDHFLTPPKKKKKLKKLESKPVGETVWSPYDKVEIVSCCFNKDLVGKIGTIIDPCFTGTHEALIEKHEPLLETTPYPYGSGIAYNNSIIVTFNEEISIGDTNVLPPKFPFAFSKNDVLKLVKKKSVHDQVTVIDPEHILFGLEGKLIGIYHTFDEPTKYEVLFPCFGEIKFTNEQIESF